MAKDFSLKGTTKLQREKYADEALALSSLGAPEPSAEAMALLQEYIDGKCELADVQKRVIEMYKVDKNV